MSSLRELMYTANSLHSTLSYTWRQLRTYRTPSFTIDLRRAACSSTLRRCSIAISYHPAYTTFENHYQGQRVALLTMKGLLLCSNPNHLLLTFRQTSRQQKLVLRPSSRKSC